MLLSAKRVPPDSLQKLLATMKVLPSSARILPPLQRLLADPESSAGELIDLLRLDATLTSRIIEVSNRACYRRGDDCASLSMAIQRIGFGEVYRVVATVAAQAVFNQSMPLYGLADGAMLEESISAGIAVSALNQGARLEVNGDELYTAGLLHGIGKLALDRYALALECEEKVVGLDGHALLERERELFGATHPQIARLLLHRWQFPERICAMVEHQWNPPAAGDFAPLAALLRLALRSQPYMRHRGLDPAELEADEDLRMLAIPEERLAPLINLARDMYDAFRGGF